MDTNYVSLYVQSLLGFVKVIALLHADKERAATNLRVGDIVERHMIDNDVVRNTYIATYLIHTYKHTYIHTYIHTGAVQSASISA